MRNFYDINSIFVVIESHPRRDRRILNMLKEYYDEVEFAGGVGKNSERVISIDDNSATFEDVSDILSQYIKSGVVKSVDEV